MKAACVKIEMVYDMSIQGILFDLYGTLLVYGNMKKAWTDWLSTFYHLLRQQGLNISKETFSKECDGFFSADEPVAGEDQLTALERRIKFLCESLNLQLGKKELPHIADTIAEAWQNHITIDPETIPVLTALKRNKTIGLVSNFDHPPHVRDILANYTLDPFFDTIVISGDVGVKKPNPAIFSFALEQTGLSKNEVIYVGDTDEDVAGAMAAGIRPILLSRAVQGTDNTALDYRSAHSGIDSPNHFSSKNEIRVIKSLKEVLIIANH
ncbi:MAG: HAD family hydrolase [Desulfobacterales bacterium]|jgi:putative hydrolase of the HAD superfamily